MFDPLPFMDTQKVDDVDNFFFFGFTDGLSETFDPDGEEFGEDRVLEFLNSSVTNDLKAKHESLLEKLDAFRRGEPFRDDITDPDSVLHHSDWLVANIGNVFGTAIKQSTAEVFVTSSSNYGAGFGFINNSPAVLNYGVVGSPANHSPARQWRVCL